MTDQVQFGLRKVTTLPTDPPLFMHSKTDNPFDATVVSIETLKPEDGKTPPSRADVFKVVLDLTGSNFVTKDGKHARIVPGHHLMVIPNIPENLGYLQRFRNIPYAKTENLPFQDPADRKFLHERRYSVADVEEGKNGVRATLVVKRVTYTEGGKKREGLVSNQLAKLKPGDKISVFGPNTNRFLMPPERDANMLFFSTGIASMAPLQDFFQTRFIGQKGKLGETRFYTGYRKAADEMCREQYQAYADNPDNRFTYRSAFSRDPNNPQRIGNIIRQDGKEVLALLDKDNTYVYLCGIWGVEVSVISALLQAALEQGKPIDDVLDRIQEMKKSGHWRVEGSRQPYRYR